MGKNTDNDNIYHFLITTDSEKTWAEGWENKPACIMRNLKPEDEKKYIHSMIKQKIEEAIRKKEIINNINVVDRDSLQNVNEC